MRSIKLFLIVVLSCLFAACATKAPLEDKSTILLNANLMQLKKWQLKGKIAWITPDERKSAYISWRQDHDDMQFDLNNLLGINLASMQADANTASLTANNETYYNSSPSLLIYQTTGWQVPLESLKYWIKGASSELGRQQDNKHIVTRYPNGLVKEIQTSQHNEITWTVSYQSYESNTIAGVEYQLPKQVSLYNPSLNATIKILISQWSE